MASLTSSSLPKTAVSWPTQTQMGVQRFAKGLYAPGPRASPVLTLSVRYLPEDVPSQSCYGSGLIVDHLKLHNIFGKLRDLQWGEFFFFFPLLFWVL